MEMHDPAFPTAGKPSPALRPPPQRRTCLPKHYCRQALDDSADGVLIVSCTSPQLPILHANPAFGRLTGLAPEQLTGYSARRLAENDSGWTAALEAYLAYEARPPVLLSGKDQAGLPFWHELRVAAMRLPCLLCTLRDVSDARVQQSRLAHVLVHDELTGLPNRAAFPAQFRSAISRAAERGQAVAVLSLALDGQALVNETLGQFARDALVHAAAARLKACLL
ncbi:diguanylate cyclase [Massilia sp. B-10]|nr:diguanylate cyclase [Massilia sp. B-10]